MQFPKLPFLPKSNSRPVAGPQALGQTPVPTPPVYSTGLPTAQPMLNNQTDLTQQVAFARKKPRIVFIIPAAILVVLLIVFAVVQLAPRFKGVSGNGNLVWWGLWEEESVVAPLIAEYESKNPGVKIKYVKQSQKDYRERLTNSLAKGEGPDIFRYHNTWVPMFKNYLDKLPTSVMSTVEFSNTFFPIITSDLSTGSGIVGMPLEYDGLLLFINEDIFARNGVTPPVTWDDLRQSACQLTTMVKGVIDQSGIALGRTENVDHWQEVLALMMLQNNVNLKKPTGALAGDVFGYFSGFANGKACRQYGLGKTWDETLPSSTLSFAAGKVAMYFGPSWRVMDIKQQNPKLKFRTIPLPQLPKQSPNDPNYAYASYWVEGVWSKSKDNLQAWQFLKYLSSKESLAKLYQNASKLDPAVRPFGEPYPRIDMVELIRNDQYLGTLVAQAPDARSWYLAARTWDGITGINSQINKYFEDAVNAINKGQLPEKALQTVELGVSQVLFQFGTSK